MISLLIFLEMVKRLSYLLLILMIFPIQCMIRTQSIEQSGYLFIKSLLDPITGLAGATAAEIATVHQNALAAMVLIHEGDIKAAEQILSHFQQYYLLNRDNFQGLPQNWNPKTGLPDTNSIHWEGDAALLLLALTYYVQKSGNSDNYHDLASGLVTWLSQQANSCNLIVAEGVADMYAALAPFSTNPLVQNSLEQLRQCFFAQGQISSADYEQNLHHIIRGALVFADTSGFAHLDNFVQSAAFDSISKHKFVGYSIFAGNQAINVEVTTEVLLASKIFQRDRQFKAFALCREIERQICSNQNKSQQVIYSMTDDKLAHHSKFSLLEPVCYLLFSHWNFNPYAMAKKSAAGLAASNDKKNYSIQ